MGISVAIATHNRARDLDRTLQSLERIDSRGEDYEILVIDNRSEDQTPSIVKRFEPRFDGRLRYVHEDRLGLSHARNRAIEEAQYEIVAFLDDDVDVDPEWLRGLSNAYRSTDVAVVGGRAFLVYPKSRPRWLGERDEGLLTKVDHGKAQRLVKPDEVYGVNLSFKKEWLDRVGMFRTDLGRIGVCLLSSEEEEVLERIARAGGRLLYDPAATVGHRVAPERLKRRWFWSRIYWGKRGTARMAPDSLVSPYEFLRSTWHIWLASWDTARAALRHGPASEEAFHQSNKLAGRAGYWVGILIRLASHRRAGPKFDSIEDPGRSRNVGPSGPPARASAVSATHE
jgi:glucosyl-dolichyl phosphate glucuronosyltransferase